MSEELEKKQTDAAAQLKELRETLEPVAKDFENVKSALAKLDGLDKEKVEKLNADITQIQKNNQELYLARESEKKSAEDQQKFVSAMEDRIKTMEKSHIMSGGSQEEAGLQENLKSALGEFFKKGCSFSTLSDESKSIIMGQKELDRKYMGSDVGVNGGHLMPDPLANFWMAEARKSSPLLNRARIISERREQISVPVVRNDVNVASLGQAESVLSTKIKTDKATITAHRIAKQIEVTENLLSFSNFDIVSYITQNSMDQITEEIDRQGVVGDGGSNQMYGIARNKNLDAGAATTSGVTLTEVMKLEPFLFGADRRESVFIMNADTATTLRTEQSTAGGYLWVPGAEGRPERLNGKPVLIFDHMDNDSVSGDVSVVLGNLQKYMILDALTLRAKVDTSTEQDADIVRYTWSRYIGGDIVDEKAFKYLKRS